ncbi:MAG: hypothetical protein SGJ00_05290 [bacterium]|nr:hypothetical protein [bacterium]
MLATIFSFNFAKAQCNGNCEPSMLCKDMTFSDFQNSSEPYPCPIVFCFDQQLVCGGIVCQSYAPLCSEIQHRHTKPYSQICYRSTGAVISENCEGCEIQTTSISIYRKYPGGSSFATITLSTTEITNLMTILNGGGGSLPIVGMLNDCEGGTIPSTVTVGTNPGGGLYCIVN